MHTGSFSSRPPRKARQSVQPPSKETKKIDDRNWCSNTFSKRHICIVSKASELSELTGTPVAVIMFSPGGKLRYFGKPSVEKVFLMYLCHEYDVKLPMSPKEGVDWAKKMCDSCVTKEDCVSLIINYQNAVVRLLKKLEGFENNPSFLQPLRSFSRRNMQTGSSPSSPPRKPSTKHSQTPQISVQPPPKETRKINDRKRCSTMFSKRHRCILSKASELSKLAGTPVAVIMFSPGGKLRYFGKPSVEEVFSEYLSCKSCMMLPTSRRELVEECDPCATKEDCASLIMKYLDAVVRLLKKSKDFENNPSVNAGAGRDPEVAEIHSMLKDLEATDPSIYKAIFKPFFFDCCDLAAGDESSRVDSNPTCSNPEGWESDFADFCDKRDEFAPLYDVFRTSPQNSASRLRKLSGEESSLSDPEGNENNANEDIFAALESLNVPLWI